MPPTTGPSIRRGTTLASTRPVSAPAHLRRLALLALVGAAAQMLKENGHPEQAAKVNSLFQDSGANGGFRQFAAHLKMLRTLNARNATNPNNRASEYLVEDAMELTLKDAGILVSAKSLMKVGDNFQPSGPPRGK